MYSILRRRLLLNRLEDRFAPALITVNSTADTGLGTLRSSILLANSGLAPGADTIVFDASVFSTAQTIALTSGELLISEHLTITGPASGVIISGSNVSRVLNVSAAGAVVVSMSDLTIANGKATGSGGGIATKGGSIALTRCTVTGNQATGNGGGIDANTSAVVSLTDCTVANNKASVNGGGLGVGSSSLTILRSTVSGNSALDGGGLYFAGAVGASGLTIRNSTFSGNSGTSDGGGVALQTFTGTLLVQNSTLTANSAVGFGGGVRQNSGAGTISVESSIVQGNFAGTGLEISTSGTVTAKTTAFGTTVGIKTYTNNGGNLIGSSILFGPLAISGGTTQTHALLPGSSGVDARASGH